MRVASTTATSGTGMQDGFTRGIPADNGGGTTTNRARAAHRRRHTHTRAAITTGSTIGRTGISKKTFFATVHDRDRYQRATD